MSAIYLDHNATTPLRPEARKRWLEVLDSGAANASSVHGSGRRARAIIDQAREQVAASLGVHEDEIFFTSGGTEGNNWALRSGLAMAAPGAGLVTTAIEHSSVLSTARAWEQKGGALTLVGVDSDGYPQLDQLRERLHEGCVGLVSVMAANNEVGSLSDLAGVREAIQAAGSEAYFHTDAVQALGKVKVDLAAWGVDLASFSAHKLGGPTGVGFLWKRKGLALPPLIHGGGQENELRSGTENVGGIAAMACAVEFAVREQPSFEKRVRGMLQSMWKELRDAMPGIPCLGPLPGEPRSLPNTLCVGLGRSDGKVMITQLDLGGLEASAGSACASGSVEPSHVLLAMGSSDQAARMGLRLSLGRNTTELDCKAATRLLIKLFGASHAT